MKKCRITVFSMLPILFVTIGRVRISALSIKEHDFKPTVGEGHELKD